MHTASLMALAACVVVATACGDKVPESEAARKLGSAPKAIVDKATLDANQALKQGAERTSDADSKN